VNRPEQAIHRSCVHYLRTVLPNTWLVMHAANGGLRSKSEAGIFKALGVVPAGPTLVYSARRPRAARRGSWKSRVMMAG
jgi:hypothetical protein